MSGPIYFSGTIDLKEGVEFKTILDLYIEEACAQDDDPMDADETFHDWDDQVRLTFEGGQLQYHVDFSDGSYDFANNFEDFLKAMAATHAAKGWISWEGEPGDDQIEVTYGPDEISKAQAELELAAMNLDAATKAYGVVYAKFMRAVADAAQA